MKMLTKMYLSKKWRRICCNFVLQFILLISCNLYAGDLVAKAITGKVTDNEGQELPGVNVLIKNSSIGTVTDIQGNYSIDFEDENTTLIFSYVGYISQEISVGNKSVIDIILQSDVMALEEIVVVGYGTTKKKDLVSSVVSIDSDVLQNQPTSRLDNALQGRASGVEVTSNNGAPGSAATVRIRGTSSINGNNDPLYVVDGFIAGTNFNLNSLSVNDIQSIEVLKDATALSIYGTRGAAGVILVTTKSGKQSEGGPPTVSVNHYTSVQEITNNFEVLNGQEYLDYKNEASQFVPGPDGFGITDPSLDVEFPGTAADYSNTDWISLIAQNGIINNTDVSVSGNKENLNYYLSFNRFDQKGVIKNSGLERYSFRSNFDLNISKMFRTGIRLNVADINTENNKVDWWGATNRLLSIRPVYNEDGTFDGINPQSGRDERNPVADIELRQDNRNTRDFIGNAYLEFEPIEGLIFRSTIGTSFSSFRDSRYLPGELPERNQNNLGGEATVIQNRLSSILNENTVTYRKKVNNHSFTVLGGVTWQKDITETSNMSASGFVNDAVGFNNISLGSEQTTFDMNTGYLQRTYSSLLGRIDYSYKSKYLLTVAGRRDGSSVFETGNKYAFFPSAGVGWNLHEEAFVQAVPVISFLKLRASYGKVGEQGVRPYNSIATFAKANTYFNRELFNAVKIGALPSSNLSWETTKQLDIGLELGLFDGRINLETSFYNKITEDLLLERKVPGTVGDTRLENVGEIENKGIDLSLKTLNISKTDFFWETTLILQGNRNTVVDLGGVDFFDLLGATAGGTSMRLIVGETMPSFYGATYLGTYKNSEEIVEDGWEGKGFIGGPRFDDVNDDGDLTDEDGKPMGSPQPDFSGGFRNVFNYKGLTLDLFFQFTYGNEILNVARQSFIFGKEDFNLSRDVLDRWQEGVNETSDIPRAGTNRGSFFPPNTIWVEDASFLRLKQITLSYDLPVAQLGIDKVFKRLNVYVTGNNLWLLSNFSLGDPEVNFYGSNTLRQGVYSGQYPYTRSYMAGITLDF